jgi:hypothetical protein
MTQTEVRTGDRQIDVPSFAAIPLQPLFHPRHNNRPIRQQDDEEHILDWSFNRVRKAYKPKRNRRCAKFLSLQCSDLYVVKSRHKIGSDLSRFLFGYGVGRILFTGLKDVSSVPPSFAAPRNRKSSTDRLEPPARG